MKRRILRGAGRNLSSPTMKTTDELFEPSKRPKFNLVFEQEENIVLEEIINTEAMG